MKSTLVILALVFALTAQTQCSLTERLSAVGSKMTTVKADAKSGKLDTKTTCNSGNSGNCKQCQAG